MWLNDDVALCPGALATLVTTSRKCGQSASIPIIVVGETRDPHSGLISYGGWRSVSSYMPLKMRRVTEVSCPTKVDAMNGNGAITILLSDQTQFVYIDISDTGKGIQKSKYKTVFEPGYTTKQRGWGLGLSLTKRIIENYHAGKIFVKNSEIDKGTTFRIVLKK